MYKRKTEQELKDILGWVNGSRTDLTTEILYVIMALCDKVATLRSEVETLKSLHEVNQENTTERQG